MDEHKVIYYDLGFPNIDKFKMFLEDFHAINLKRGHQPLTDQESDIVNYCLVQPENFIVESVNNSTINDTEWIIIKIKLIDPDKNTLYGENSWIPFLAKYMMGEFHIKGQWDDVWGAKLYGDGTYDKITAEIRMVKEHEANDDM